MPERFISKSGFVGEVIHKMETSRVVTNVIVPQLAQKYAIEVLGFGSQHVVFVSSDENKVVAFRYEDLTSEEAKAEFYVHRIMHTLFSNNFPKFHATFAASESSVSGSIRQRIIPVTQDSSNHVEYPFSTVNQFIKEKRIPVSIDNYTENFCVSEDGGEYYLDSIGFVNYALWPVENIISYMEKNGDRYNQTDISRVKKSFLRLGELEIIDLRPEQMKVCKGEKTAGSRGLIHSILKRFKKPAQRQYH